MYTVSAKEKDCLYFLPKIARISLFLPAIISIYFLIFCSNNALLQNNLKNPHPNQTGLVGLFYLWKAFPLPTFSIKIVFNLKLKIKINQPTNQTPKVFQSIKSLNFSSLRFSTIVRRGKNCSTLPHNTTLKKAKLESLKLCFLYGI